MRSGRRATTSFGATVAEAKATADRRASLVPLIRLKEASHLVPGAISTLSSLRTDDRAVTVTAEVKRFTATFADLGGVGDPGMLACFYAAGGAAYVSVVTGPNVTRGSLKDLDAVRASVDPPVLANDLVITSYQVYEAWIHGTGLLILDTHLGTLMPERLIERVHSLGMGTVAGVRTRREVLTTVDTGACIVAIDTHDPNTLAVNCDLFNQITDVLPTQVIRIAAGGVRGPHGVMSFARYGADVVLVSKAIIHSIDPQQFIAGLVAAGTHPILIPSTHREVL